MPDMSQPEAVEDKKDVHDGSLDDYEPGTEALLHPYIAND